MKTPAKSAKSAKSAKPAKAMPPVPRGVFIGNARRPATDKNIATTRTVREIPVISGSDFLASLAAGRAPTPPATPLRSFKEVVPARPARVGPSGLACPTCGPIPHVLIEGSIVRDRVLEGVYFEASYPEGTREAHVQSRAKDADYLRDLNMVTIMKDLAESALDLEDATCPTCGDDVQIPF